MPAFTVIELRGGVMSFHTENAEESPGLRFLTPAISLLTARGGGKMLLPHTPAA